MDIVTQASVFEAVDAAVTAHMEGAAASEFTGQHICVANLQLTRRRSRCASGGSSATRVRSELDQQ